MNLKTLLIIFIIIVTLGIGGWFLFTREKWAGSNGDSAGLIVGKNAIYMAEQAPSKMISVAVAHFEKPGFVVIHEEASGELGKILGVSALVTAGETNSLRVTLSRPAIDEETFYAMLHLDDGDEVFDATKDKPALDLITSEPVMTIVTISQDAVEPGAVNP